MIFNLESCAQPNQSNVKGKRKTFSDIQDSETVLVGKEEAMALRNKGFHEGKSEGSPGPRAKSQPGEGRSPGPQSQEED